MAILDTHLPHDVKSVFELAHQLAADNDQLRADVVHRETELQAVRAELNTHKAESARKLQQMENENLALLARLESLTQQLADATDRDRQQVLQLEIKKLHQDLADRNKALYGTSRSERRRRPSAEKQEDSSPKPRKRSGRTPQPELPIRMVRHELDVTDQACPCCGGQLCEWEGQTENSDEIGIQRIRYEIRRHVKQKYRCSGCDHIETAIGPAKLAAGSRYSIDFAVDATVDRHGAHIPYTRQIARMQSSGLTVTSQTLWDLEMLLYLLLLPTFLALKQFILHFHHVLHADETRWPMLTRGGAVRWWAWILSASNATIIELSPSRGQAAARKLLADFDQVLVADAYSVYTALERYKDRHGIQPDLEGEIAPEDRYPMPNYDLAGCWDHARRPLYEAEPAFPEASKALDIIGKMYAVEAEATRRAAEGEDLQKVRSTLRQERTRPLIAELQAWMKEQQPIPGLKLDSAIGYLRNQWRPLLRFLDDPAIPISNIRAEHRARAIVLSRNSSVGSRSEMGAEVTATMWSMIESSRLNGLDPRRYLLEVATRNARDRSTVLLPHEYAAELAWAQAAADLMQSQTVLDHAQAALSNGTGDEVAVRTAEAQHAAREATASAAKSLLARCQRERTLCVTWSKEHAELTASIAEDIRKKTAAEEASRKSAQKAREPSAAAPPEPTAPDAA